VPKEITKVAENAETAKNKLHVCKENGKVCSTPGCIHAASSVLSKMDVTVDPCEDFYKFSCGQFLDNTRIPEDKIYVNSFSVVGDLLQEQLRTLITSPVDEKDIGAFKNVKKFYLACMNESEFIKG
jgi:neprilysin